MLKHLKKVVFFGLVALISFSCQKSDDAKPAIKPNNLPVRIAKSLNTTGLSNSTDGFASYVITTSSGYTYTLTFQEVNGYTTLNVTHPGGTTGDCLDRLVVILERWINDAQTIAGDPDNACSLLRTFTSDMRSIRDCVPSSEQGNFDEALDQMEESIDVFCQ